MFQSELYYTKTVQQRALEYGVFEHCLNFQKEALEGGSFKCSALVFNGNFHGQITWFESADGEFQIAPSQQLTETFPVDMWTLYETFLKENRFLVETNACRLGKRCTKCKKDFKSEYGIERHIDIDACKFKSAECLVCRKWYSNEACLRRHTLKCHSMSEEQVIVPELNQFIGVHKKQIIPKKQPKANNYSLLSTESCIPTKVIRDANVLNTIYLRCTCAFVTTSEVTFKQHALKCKSPQNIQETRAYWTRNANVKNLIADPSFTREFLQSRNQVSEDQALFNYIYRDGERPTNIINDVRLLGFRYIGQRTIDMDLTTVMNQQQIELELRHKYMYKQQYHPGTYLY